MKPMKKIALLHSMCSVGKASLTNMIPILSTMGVEVCPIPTVLLSTHTGEYDSPARQAVTPDYIRACADHYRDNGVNFDLIFVGYLENAEMVSAVQYFLDQFVYSVIVFDPIMGDHGNFYANLNENYLDAYLKLFPYGHVMIPNLTEACILTGTSYKEHFEESELKELCEKLHNIGGIRDIIVTSACTKPGTKGIAYSSARNMELFAMPAEPQEFHGSGDIFDAVAIGYFLQGKTWKESIQKAHQFVCECIRESSKYDYPEREGLMPERLLSLLV